MPSAFVNTDVDEDVIMVLKGDLADMMVQIAPKTYRKYITTDKKGTRILYVKLQKSTVRTNTSEPALLQETEKGTQGIWTCCESL